jgi:hypothetical protein
MQSQLQPIEYIYIHGRPVGFEIVPLFSTITIDNRHSFQPQTSSLFIRPLPPRSIMIFLVLEEHWLLGLLSWIFSFGSPFNDTLLPEHTSSILQCILLQSLTVLWNLLTHIWHRAQLMLKEDWRAFDAMIREYLNEGTFRDSASNLHVSRKGEVRMTSHYTKGYLTYT